MASLARLAHFMIAMEFLSKVVHHLKERGCDCEGGGGGVLRLAPKRSIL